MHFPEEKRSVSNLCISNLLHLQSLLSQEIQPDHSCLSIIKTHKPEKLQKSGHQVDSSCISTTRTTSQHHHRTQANMFNLEDTLNYLRPDPLPTTHDFFADYSVALHSDGLSLCTKLFLIGLTTMIIFTVAASWGLGEQAARRLGNGDLFAALEDIQMNLESQVSWVPRPGIEGRILPRMDPPPLDEIDSFMLPPPADWAA